LSFRCNDRKRCPRCAAQHQIEGGFEDPADYLSAAVYILDSLEAYKRHPNYEQRKGKLRSSSYPWVWIVAEAIKETKSLSHYGAIIMPPVLAQKICEDKKLGDYFVQRCWNNDHLSFDYLLGMDPSNSHYYSWWRINLEDHGDLEEFLKIVNYGLNMERWGDIIEACLGILIIAERVPELQRFLLTFMPEEVASWMVLNSLSDSIRNFVGWRQGSKSKRKKSSSSPEPNLRWTVTFDTRYITPPWEFQKGQEQNAQPVTKRPDISLGIEPLNTIMCASSQGASFIHCNCTLCILIRRALCRANPVLRSVMARTGEQQLEFTEQAYDILRQLVEQSYQPAIQEELPHGESAGSGEVGPGPLPHRTDGSGVGPGPLPGHGVTLQTFFTNLRGTCGERKRDTTTKFETG
jgi:hypothetical protein